MTVAGELAREGQRIEYFVTVEGAGWVSGNLGDTLTDFNGVVWATQDINGTLASILGCTVYTGLSLPESISESIDPRTAMYSPGGMSFKVIDHDDWWLTNLAPRRSGTETTIYNDGTGVGLHPFDNNVKLDDGTAFAENDLAWVGGRELVKLGPKIAIAGNAYRFYPSTRGYLGTQRGSSRRRPEDYCIAYWPVGTSVSNVSRWWWNRQVALWAHVPGEAVGNCQLLWYGRLRDINNPSAGIEWSISCTGDFMSAASRIHRAVDWNVTCLSRISQYQADTSTEAVAAYGKRVMMFSRAPTAKFGGDSGGLYELAAAYQYRTEPGGTFGMVGTWDTGAGSGTVQALDIGADADILRSFVMIDDAVYFMHMRDPAGPNAYQVLGDMIPYAGADPMASAARSSNGSAVGGVELPSFGASTKARFLLSNYGSDKATNRFQIDGNVTRRPIDTLLIFMLSSDREFYRADAAAGSTSTVIQLASSGADTNLWAGKALFCMEGAYRWQARPITANDATSITLSPGFTGAPGVGIEVQVRNSIYDVLPIGWGMGVPAANVDIASFEAVQRDHLGDVTLGEFIIGNEDETDIWELLVKNILQPYGILVYFDHETRKITARHIGQMAEDGAFEDYVAIGQGDIIDIGDVRHTFSNPLGSIRLRVRKVNERITGLTRQTSTSTSGAVGMGQYYAPVNTRVASMMGEKTAEIVIRSDEANTAFSENELDQVTIQALFNTEDDYSPLAGRLVGLVGEYSVPPSVWTPLLDVGLHQSLKPGVPTIINWASAPANPITGVRGWVDVVGRVVGRTYMLSGSAFGSRVDIEIMAAVTVGRLTPAAVVTSKGSDANGAYFVVDDANFVADPDADKDWWYFGVTDQLDHRDSTGATKAGWSMRTITGFGTNFVADPTLANSSRVYVSGAIGSTVAAGDYITFDAWSVSVTDRMQRYSVYSPSTGLLAGNYPAKRYG